jgi:tRNA(Arg) A34 adenosine deaminase TadA
MEKGNITDYCLRNVSDYIPTKIERNYSFLAYKLSLNSTVKSGRHCSILIDGDDNILSVFVNRYNLTSSVHSEVGCINEYLEENNKSSLKNCRILVIRGTFLGEMTLSKPCLECFKCIKKSGIKTIIYSSGHKKYQRVYID